MKDLIWLVCAFVAVGFVIHFDLTSLETPPANVGIQKNFDAVGARAMDIGVVSVDQVRADYPMLDTDQWN